MKFIILILMYIVSSSHSYAQTKLNEMFGAACITERYYNYVAGDSDFKIINKNISFCYNMQFFGFINKQGDVLVFPLERYKQSVNKDGYVVEEFLNSTTQNYLYGDLLVTITHSNPVSIFINNTRLNYAYYITTNSLPFMKVATKPFKGDPGKVAIPTQEDIIPLIKIDSIVRYKTKWYAEEIGKDIGQVSLIIKVNKAGDSCLVIDIGIKTRLYQYASPEIKQSRVLDLKNRISKSVNEYSKFKEREMEHEYKDNLYYINFHLKL